MGLTGFILDAQISLRRIKSAYIDECTIKNNNLSETFLAFEKYSNSPYSVAWIDCLAKGKKMGRSLLMLGDFSDDGRFKKLNKRRINIPFVLPNFFLNKFTVKLFNFLYFNKNRKKKVYKKTYYENFFYPLDSISNWNRIYGKYGFIQYQLIFPKKYSFDGLTEVLRTISNNGKGAFLAVLKLHGPENENYLSFPKEGYSLAMDFKIEKGLFELLDTLDKILIKYKGRIYLAKDVRISSQVFEQGYPKINLFRKLRVSIDAKDKFNSLQSKRLKI